MDERRPDIWIVRHGETDWSRRGLHTGRTNVPLTAVGEREAIALRSRFDGRRFALVLSSPLSRAQLFALGTSSIGVLGYEREVHVIRAWNLTAETGQ